MDDLKLLNFWTPLTTDLTSYMKSYFSVPFFEVRILHNFKLDGTLEVNLEWFGSHDDLVVSLLHAQALVSVEQLVKIMSAEVEVPFGLTRTQVLLFNEIIKINSNLIKGWVNKVYQSNLINTVRKARESVSIPLEVKENELHVQESLNPAPAAKVRTLDLPTIN